MKHTMQAFPFVCCSSASTHYCKYKVMNKIGTGLGAGLTRLKVRNYLGRQTIAIPCDDIHQLALYEVYQLILVHV